MDGVKGRDCGTNVPVCQDNGFAVTFVEIDQDVTERAELCPLIVNRV